MIGSSFYEISWGIQGNFILTSNRHGQIYKPVFRCFGTHIKYQNKSYIMHMFIMHFFKIASVYNEIDKCKTIVVLQ